MRDINHAQHKVLVVEDDGIILMEVADQLKDAGFQVETAIDGVQAFKAAAKVGGVDVLFTDVRLPGKMDGLDLAAKLKQVGLCRAVIYTTGYMYEPPRMVSPSLLLRKPYRTGALIKAIHGLINLAVVSVEQT